LLPPTRPWGCEIDGLTWAFVCLLWCFVLGWAGLQAITFSQRKTAYSYFLTPLSRPLQRWQGEETKRKGEHSIQRGQMTAYAARGSCFGVMVICSTYSDMPFITSANSDCHCRKQQ
jgi:hypothetical protein